MHPLNGKFAMNNRALVVFIMVFAWLTESALHSQTGGNPVGTAGKGQTTMGMSGAYQIHEDGQQKMVSNRIFFKAMYRARALAGRLRPGGHHPGYGEEHPARHRRFQG